MKMREKLSLATMGLGFVCAIGGASAVEFSTTLVPDSFWVYAMFSSAFLSLSMILDKPSRILKHITALDICIRVVLYKLGHTSKTNTKCYKLSKHFHRYSDIYEYVIDEYEENLSNDGLDIFM